MWTIGIANCKFLAINDSRAGVTHLHFSYIIYVYIWTPVYIAQHAHIVAFVFIEFIPCHKSPMYVWRYKRRALINQLSANTQLQRPLLLDVALLSQLAFNSLISSYPRLESRVTRGNLRAAPRSARKKTFITRLGLAMQATHRSLHNAPVIFAQI